MRKASPALNTGWPNGQQVARQVIRCDGDQPRSQAIRKPATAQKDRNRAKRRYSPEVRKDQCKVRLRIDLPDAFHPQGRHRPRNLRRLPPVLHWQAEADRHRRSRGPVPSQVRAVGLGQSGSGKEVTLQQIPTRRPPRKAEAVFLAQTPKRSQLNRAQMRCLSEWPTSVIIRRYIRNTAGELAEWLKATVC